MQSRRWGSGPTSSRSRRPSGYQVEALQDVLLGLLPEGPPMYPDGELTDEPEAVMVAELIREAALEGVATSCRTRWRWWSRRWCRARAAHDGLLDVRVNLFVERDSQKGIVIGKGGARLRDVGNQRAAGDRGAARRAGVPRPARQGGQGLAARPEAAPPAGVLRRRSRPVRSSGSEEQGALGHHDARCRTGSPGAVDLDVQGARPTARDALEHVDQPSAGRPSRTSRAASGPAAVPVAGSSAMPTVGLKNRA